MNNAMLNELLLALGINADLPKWMNLTFVGDDRLVSCFNATDLASNSFMAAAVALAEYCDVSRTKNASNNSTGKSACVNNRYASLWFDQSLWALDWQVGGKWDAIAGDYRCADGWIRLHTNATHHRQAAIGVLQCDGTRDAVAATLASMSANEVEAAIVDANGCAATMRSLDAWQRHPQGKSVASEPLMHWDEFGTVDAESDHSQAGEIVSNRPLSGLRVLDLTRVIAGPVSTRLLAAYGADVLRIDPTSWDEPSVVPEMTLGKRCAHLELNTQPGLDRFFELVKKADVLVHGYRPGAMDGLGLSLQKLMLANPGLINVSLCAYGWTGPWSKRRGFDSLVQMSSGIAHQGMLAFNSDKPHPLPVQALDHATGNLMAAAVLHALAEKRRTGRVLGARLSLAKTAHVLQQYRQDSLNLNFEPTRETDLHPHIENTAWGAAQRVRFPIELGGISAHWDRPATPLRSLPAQWH